MTDRNASAQALIERVTEQLVALPAVEAVALSGSRSAGVADAHSDIDLVVYTRAEIDLATRHEIVQRAGGATQANMGLTFWGPCDEWFDAATGIEVDLTYFDAAWMEQQIDRVVREHQPSLGYSTCFWRTVQRSQRGYDRAGWLQGLEQRSATPYPEALRQNIIRFNHPVLREVIPAYLHQIEKAVQRDDRVSLNHRVAGLLASYFDIVFALNRVPHPGEKRILAYAAAECPALPTDMAADVIAVLNATGQEVIALINRLLDRLDHMLAQAGFGPGV